MPSLKNLNGFLTSDENQILDYVKFNEKREHISKLREEGLYPFQKSELFKQLIQTYDGQEPEPKSLIDTSIEHIQKHSNLKLKDNLIVLVHPFFLYLHHNPKIPIINNLLTNRHVEDSLEYIENLQRVLSGDKYLDYSIVFFEETDTYYQFSSSFLERKIIDDIKLTRNYSGRLIRGKENKLNNFKCKNLFFGGGYAASYDLSKDIRIQCLDEGIDETNKSYYKQNEKPRIHIIEDFSINSAVIGESLFEHTKNKIYHKNYSASQIVKLDDL